MFHESADFYDAIYAPVKDYRAEAGRIATLLIDLNPRYHRILDVACGTGEHARHLAVAGFSVDGVDLNPDFIRIARSKHPNGQFFEADMSHFQLTERYDAILCLFSSIAYLKTIDRVTQACTCFRDHLLPGGVVLVEPWLEPGILDAARVSRDVATLGDQRITRTCHIELQPGLSRLHFDYEIEDPTGTRHASEVHELGLFTKSDHLAAFHRAGLQATHDPIGLTNRGLYIARVSDPNEQ